MSALPPGLVRIYAFVLGAMVGSFLNVVIARLPAGESVVRPRSKCPKCGAMIPAWLNIPIVSWIVLRGKCIKCKAPISIRYPVVELLTAVLFLAIAVRFGAGWATLHGMILAGALVAITFVDIDIWEIPDEISLPGVVVGCLLRPIAYGVPWWDGIAGAVIGAGFLWLIRWTFWHLRKVEGMGFGDVKLIAMIGAFLGPFGLLPTIMVASISGSVIGLVVLLVNRGKEAPVTEPPPPLPPPEDAEESADEEEWVPPKNAVPFGPFLALGALAELLMGHSLRAIFFELLG